VQLINTAAATPPRSSAASRELYRERGETARTCGGGPRPLPRGSTALTEPRWKSQARPRHQNQGRAGRSRDPVDPRAIPARIREMLTNLIFNAVDAMPEGGTITVRAACERRTTCRSP
jgi:signal transduction histidine kinase